MSRAAAKKPAKTAAERGIYVRKGRGRAPDPRPTLRERRAMARDERLAEIGLLPKDRQASYAAARPSTFRRQRLDLGGEADAHIRNEIEFWRLRELSRSMDRDDAIPGPVVEAWLDLVLGSGADEPGIQMDPQTTFPVLDRAIKDDMRAWGLDPSMCDVSGRFTLSMLERLGLRHSAFDGDALVILHRDGATAGKVQLLEGDRLAGCDGPAGNIVHGVEVDPETAEVVAYWVLKRRPANRKQTGYRAPKLDPSKHDGLNYKRIPARDAQGRLNATLIINPKRVTEYRAVTKWHRVFDQLGMTEDTFFATVAGIQSSACIPMAITVTTDVKLGKREENDDEGDDDGVAPPPEEEFTPNTVPRLKAGESLVGAPSAGPSPDTQKFLDRVFRLVAMQVDLPYSMAFRDTSATVFHGWRGENEQAKRAARWHHTYFPAQFSRPVYDFRLDFALERLRKNPEMARLIEQAEAKDTIRAVRAQPRAWPYVDPKTDREADALGISEGLESARATHAERGRDIDDVRRERHEDIAAERKAAKERAKEEGEPDEWRAYCAKWALGVMPTPGAAAPPQLAKPGDQPAPAKVPTPEPSQAKPEKPEVGR